MIHALIAVAVQALLTLAGVDAWAAGAIPAALYAGREHAQAEYRIIKARYGRRAVMPWWGGFLPAAWNWKALLDVALPCGAACSFALLA